MMKPPPELIAGANGSGLLDMRWHVGQQRQIARPLYGQCQGMLMFGTGTDFTAWLNLGSI
jgi:hypothetical protein